LQGASTLGQLGQNQYGQQMGINAAQQQAGAQQQAFNQQGLSNQYQDFLNRQNYPYQQLGFMSDILHGTPTGGVTTKQESQVAPSMFSQIAGSLGGLVRITHIIKRLAVRLSLMLKVARLSILMRAVLPLYLTRLKRWRLKT